MTRYDFGKDDFRVFYNQSIYPEMLHMERRRRRLVWLILISCLVLSALFFVAFYVQEMLLSLFLMLIAGIWVARLIFQVKTFMQAFKPRIIGLILDFIDNDINFGNFSYNAKRSITKKQFFDSLIFTKADVFEGEDYISGQIRELPFELSELSVAEISPVRNKLDRVFKGVFMVADFKRPDMEGKILLLPDAFRKYLSRTERAFHLKKGVRVTQQLLPEFEAIFDTYATPDARVHRTISEDMQRSLINYRQQHGKDFYVSIIDDKIYLAVTQKKDLLEPSLFAPNLGLELVREFHDDLQMLFALLQDIDVHN